MRSHFGVATHFRTYCSGDWEVHDLGFVWVLTRGQVFLGVDSPFFSTIVLSKNWAVFPGFPELERRIPGNGERTPRFESPVIMGEHRLQDQSTGEPKMTFTRSKSLIPNCLTNQGLLRLLRLRQVAASAFLGPPLPARSPLRLGPLMSASDSLHLGASPLPRSRGSRDVSVLCVCVFFCRERVRETGGLCLGSVLVRMFLLQKGENPPKAEEFLQSR